MLITPPHQASPSRHIGEKSLNQLIESIYIKTDSVPKVLDIGCGWAEYRFLFKDSEYTGVDITDFDFDKKMEPGVNFIVGDIFNQNFENQFEIVVINYALEYLGDTKTILRSIKKLLVPNGFILFSVPTKWVKIYEWPGKILRLAGKKSNIVASDGISYFTIKQSKEDLEEAGFRLISVKSGGGPLISILKLLQVSTNVMRKIFWHLLYLVSSKLTYRKSKLQHFFHTKSRAVNWLPIRTTRDARNLTEFYRLWELAMHNRTIMDRAYVKLIELADRLDTYLWPGKMTEFVVLATSQDNDSGK